METDSTDRTEPERPAASWWVPVIQYHDELAFEIGQVAIRSAECETSVRDVLTSLVGDDDRSWILFEGQGLSSMIDNIKSVLSIESDEYWVQIRQALDEIKLLSDSRNAVVHGTWLPINEWDEEELGSPNPRPWGDDDDDEPVWLCTRSRMRKLSHPTKWTTTDIETLADKMEKATERLMVAYARFLREESPQRFESSNWTIWLHDNVGPQGGVLPARG